MLCYSLWFKQLNKEPNVEVSDTTGADSSTKAGNKKLKILNNELA